jgi:hypothetical protein
MTVVYSWCSFVTGVCCKGGGEGEGGGGGSLFLTLHKLWKQLWTEMSSNGESDLASNFQTIYPNPVGLIEFGLRLLEVRLSSVIRY